MLFLGVGMIASCLLLSALFAWGIYLDLTLKARPCPPAPGAALKPSQAGAPFPIQSSIRLQTRA